MGVEFAAKALACTRNGPRWWVERVMGLIVMMERCAVCWSRWVRAQIEHRLLEQCGWLVLVLPVCVWRGGVALGCSEKESNRNRGVQTRGVGKTAKEIDKHPQSE